MELLVGHRLPIKVGIDVELSQVKRFAPEIVVFALFWKKIEKYGSILRHPKFWWSNFELGKVQARFFRLYTDGWYWNGTYCLFDFIGALLGLGDFLGHDVSLVGSRVLRRTFSRGSQVFSLTHADVSKGCAPQHLQRSHALRGVFLAIWRVHLQRKAWANRLDLLQLGARQWLIKRMEVLANIAIFELQRHFKEVCEGALQFISAGNYLWELIKRDSKGIPDIILDLNGV